MFRNLRVGLRLSLGFSLTLAFMITIIAVSLHQTQVSQEKLQRIVKTNNVRLQLANDMIDDAREMAISVRGILLAKYNNESDKRVQEMIGNCTALMRTYAEDIVAIKKLIPEDDAKGRGMLVDIEASGTAARALEEQAIELAVAGKLAEASSLITVKAYPAVKQWISRADEFVRHNEELTELRYTQAEEVARSARTNMFILGVTAITLSALIVILLSLSITRPLKLTVDAADHIASGDLEVDLSAAEKRGDELGVLAKSFSKMVATLRDVSVQADEISKGNYSSDIVPRSDKDVLGAALQHMTSALRENRDIAQRQDWLKTGIARLNQIMGGDPDMFSLTSKVISEISSYLDVQIGAIYLAGNGDGATLSMAGSYAYKKRGDLSGVFKMGEGLVGQAALEKRQILIKNVPEDYFRISSGLGEMVPKFICVTPFIREDRVKGVIEVGTFSEMTDRQMEYLNQAMPVLAVAVESAQNRMSLAKALVESQSLSEELQAQQEELKTMNEELEEQTKTLKVSEEELKTQQEELQVTNEELEEKNDLLDRQKKEMENAREEIEKKAEELAIAGKYKSEFLANMSHELRTPLNSLLILAQSLMDNKEGNLTADQVESARIIQSGGSDLLNLINDILDLSKIEAGRMTVQVGKIQISEFAENIRASFMHMTNEKGLKLEVIVREDAPGEIKGDRKRIEQIIRNFMSNAIKFTDSGGITVTFTRPSPDADLTRSGLSANDSLAIEVKDTGIGIALENQKIIFEAFQQIDSGMARKYGGTGLGLSISRELSRILGGEIKIVSELGKGSEFTLYLPITASAERKVDPVSAVASAVVKENEVQVRSKTRVSESVLQIDDDRDNLKKDDKFILVIEDDPDFARLLYRKCHEKNFKCLATPTGEAGLELAGKFSPSAVLLDISLPGMNGWAVLEALKENTATRHIPVHILSAEESSPEAVRKGAVGHATKPLSQADLEAAFRRFEKLSAGKPRCVLVVDDDVLTRRKTVKTINEDDVKVDEVDNGRQAIEALRSGRYDCVILDLSLPDMDGLELLERLEGENIELPPVIVYTCRELTLEEEIKIREHAEAIIIKDVRSQERLLDEVSLFLHLVVSKMPEKQRKIIRDLHDTDEILKDKKVLIVDDDMRTAFAMSRLLSEYDMKTLKAENGERAIRLLEEQPDVDIVLMDIMMPVMDGYEAIRQIRNPQSAVRNHKVPIIVLTAKAMLKDREKCIAAGANDYLPKPVDQKRLVSMMRVWLCR